MLNMRCEESTLSRYVLFFFGIDHQWYLNLLLRCTYLDIFHKFQLQVLWENLNNK